MEADMCRPFVCPQECMMVSEKTVRALDLPGLRPGFRLVADMS